MATLIDTLRTAHKRLIDQNPVAVTFSRTTRTPSNGAFTVATGSVGPQTVRVYQEGAVGGLAKLLTDLAGTQQQDRNWGLLAEWNADVAGDPNVTDEFDVAPYGHFRVADVVPLLYANQVYGKRAALERVA